MNARTARKIVKNITHARPLKYSAGQISQAVQRSLKTASPSVRDSLARKLQRDQAAIERGCRISVGLSFPVSDLNVDVFAIGRTPEVIQ